MISSYILCVYIYIYLSTSVDLSLYSDSVKWNGRLVVDRDVKRSVCFVYVFFLPYFRLMVGREVDGMHVFSLYFFFYIFD